MNFLFKMVNSLESFKNKMWLIKKKKEDRDLIRRGYWWALSKQLERIFPTRSRRYVGDEYRGEVLIMDMVEGGNFRNDLKYKYFTPAALDRDIRQTEDAPLRFYFKCIGFEDMRAKLRNWGMDYTKFRKFLRRICG